MLQSVGTSLIYVTGMSGMSLLGHLRRGNVQMLGGLAIGLPAAVGSTLGKGLAEMLAKAGQAQMVILGCFVALLLVIAAVFLSPGGSRPHSTGRPRLGRVTTGPHVYLGQHRFSLWVVLATGMGIGLLSGLLGVGGGVVILPLLIHGFGLEPAAAVGTSLICVLLSGVVGGTAYYLSGRVNLGDVALMLAGAWPGTVLGARATAILGGQRLTRYFAGLVVLAAAGIVMKLMGWTAGSGAVVYGGLLGMPAFILIQYHRTRSRSTKSRFPARNRRNRSDASAW